ncbi:hypothetical protein D3C87_1726390 [compost metagenome]
MLAAGDSPLVQARQGDDIGGGPLARLHVLKPLQQFRDQAIAPLGCKLVQADQHAGFELAHEFSFLSVMVWSARSRLDLLPLRNGMKVLPNFLQPLFTRRHASWLIQSMGQNTQSTEGSTVSIRETASRRPPS